MKMRKRRIVYATFWRFYCWVGDTQKVWLAACVPYAGQHHK